MGGRPSRSWPSFLLMLCVADVGLAAGQPVAVSPGDTSKVAVIGDPCPTFSWGEVPGASSYELVAYRLRHGERDVRPVLRKTVRGAALSWTPSVDRCLVAGGVYAWLVRAIGAEGVSAWSEPSLLQIGEAPRSLTLERVIEAVRRELAPASETTEPASQIAEAGTRADPGRIGKTGGAPGPESSAGGVVLSDASITIDGNDVLTTATDQDTLAGLTCDTDELAVKTETGWDCAAPPCPTGLTDCTGQCVDTQTDESHCGGCETTCTVGELCSTGSCGISCPDGLTECSGSCVDTLTDEAHCGGCASTCAAGTFCQGGSCTTPETCASVGLTECSLSCVNPDTDESHCGACANACGAGELCQGGTCQLSCQSELTECSGVCVNTETDESHCGACGNACADGELCEGGSCG